ncbi:MAG TPA: hypothetical protein VGW40_05175 [Allosphingosinicella sp.]|nr:hypothetical protein [Allosphingosinicella sp.]
MKGAAVFVLAASCLAGCSATQRRLECTVRERGPAAGTLAISAMLARTDDPNGVLDLQGMIEFRDGSRIVQVPTRGNYWEPADRREFELVTFADLPNRMGKLNVAVQPTHPVLRRRGTKAVVLRGEETVENATPAVASCRTMGPA